MTQSPSNPLENALVWLARDASLEQPTLVLSVFCGAELLAKLGLELNAGQVIHLMQSLEDRHAVVRTEKVSGEGPYYNIHPRFLKRFHASSANVRFAQNLKVPEAGFCIINAKKNTYRQQCEGRKCKYFLSSERQCVLGKFFAK